MPFAEAAGRLRECSDCGLFQRIPPLPPGAAASCPRCGAVQRHHRVDSRNRATAMAITGLLLFSVAAQLPLLDLQWGTRHSSAALTSGPLALDQAGMLPLSVVVLATTLAVPVIRLVAVLWVLIGLRLHPPPRHLHRVFRWVETLRPWSMVEVFLLGLFVAYTKLGDMAHVSLDYAAYALGALMLTTAGVDAALDGETVWQALERAGAVARPDHASRSDETTRFKPTPGAVASRQLIGCHCCNLVSRADGPKAWCPRCGSRLHRRKVNSLGRTTALLAAAALLYIPANMLPVMTVVELGSGYPNTILSGVRELIDDGMWPLAGLVFFASILVPVLKLLILSFLMITTHRGVDSRRRQRTVLYRIVDFIGRWSMIDVFMVSILTALVQWGRFASVTPGPGVLAFCSVVVLTMLAAASFDPRLIWDAAARRPERAVEPVPPGAVPR